MCDANDNDEMAAMMMMTMMVTTTITQIVTMGECRATVYDTEGIRGTGL